MLHRIRLSLKRDRKIGEMPVFHFKQMVIKFCHIPDIKENHEQLQLLSDVDFFMVDENFILFILRIFNEDKRIKRNAVYFCIFEELLAYNYHKTNIKVLI